MSSLSSGILIVIVRVNTYFLSLFTKKARQADTWRAFSDHHPWGDLFTGNLIQFLSGNDLPIQSRVLGRAAKGH